MESMSVPARLQLQGAARPAPNRPRDWTSPRGTLHRQKWSPGQLCPALSSLTTSQLQS